MSSVCMKFCWRVPTQSNQEIKVYRQHKVSFQKSLPGNLDKKGVKYDNIDKTEGSSKLWINFRGEKGNSVN